MTTFRTTQSQGWTDRFEHILLHSLPIRGTGGSKNNINVNPHATLPPGHLWRSMFYHTVYHEMQTGQHKGCRYLRIHYPGLDAVSVYEYPPVEEELTFEMAFGGGEGNGGLGCDLLMEKLRTKLFYLPASACTSFVIGHVMQAFIHSPQYLARALRNGSASCRPFDLSVNPHCEYLATFRPPDSVDTGSEPTSCALPLSSKPGASSRSVPTSVLFNLVAGLFKAPTDLKAYLLEEHGADMDIALRESVLQPLKHAPKAADAWSGRTMHRTASVHVNETAQGGVPISVDVTESAFGELEALNIAGGISGVSISLSDSSSSTSGIFSTAPSSPLTKVIENKAAPTSLALKIKEFFATSSAPVVLSPDTPVPGPKRVDDLFSEGSFVQSSDLEPDGQLLSPESRSFPGTSMSFSLPRFPYPGKTRRSRARVSSHHSLKSPTPKSSPSADDPTMLFAENEANVDFHRSAAQLKKGKRSSWAAGTNAVSIGKVLAVAKDIDSKNSLAGASGRAEGSAKENLRPTRFVYPPGSAWTSSRV